MIRARVRRLAAIAAIGSLLAIQAFSGSAGAAVPSADASSSAIPASYSAGEAAGFRGTFHLTDGSTLSKLFLRVDLTSSADNVYWKVTRNGQAAAGNTCGLDGEDVVCSFKTVRNTDFFVATVGYLALGDAEQVDVAFVWNSTGVPQNDDNSHGDSWDGVKLTALESDGANGNYGGGFSYNGDNTVSNAPIGPGNIQAARLVGLPVGVAATVEDGFTSGPCVDTPEVNCANASGEWVEVFVGDGLIYPVFKIEITYVSGIPKGFVHTFVNAAGDTVQEFIGPCAKKNPSFPCFTWSNQTNTATIFTLHNGSYIKIR